MKQYFKNMRYNLQYIIQSIIERDWKDVRHHFSDFKRDIIQPLRSLKYGIENLIKWLNIIWNDRDWDYYFFLIMMKKKLEGMEHQHRVYSHCIDSEKITKKMRVCIHLLDRIIEDDYCKKEYEDHDKKYGKLDIDSKPSQYDKNGKILTYKMIFNRDKVTNDRIKKYERDDFRRIIKKSDNIKNNDKNMLFDMLRRNIFQFWD